MHVSDSGGRVIILGAELLMPKLIFCIRGYTSTVTQATQYCAGTYWLNTRTLDVSVHFAMGVIAHCHCKVLKVRRNEAMSSFDNGDRRFHLL